ncbi:MAG: thioredoxin family protein, partial [Bacteroidetes bacterium]
YFVHEGYVPAQDLRIVLRLGWAAYALPRGQYEEVIVRLDEAVERFPEHPRTPALMLRRGMARYLKTWDHHAFRDEMRRLIERFPGSAEARMWPWDEPPFAPG